MFLFLKENKLKLIFVLILLIILAYIVNIDSIPESIILFENEEFGIELIAGIKLEETISVGASLGTKVTNDSNNQKKYNLSLLGINLKTISAEYIENTKVVPLGNLIGLKLYTEGVLVVGMSEIKGEDNNMYRPYEDTGIEQGDSIIEINDTLVNTTDELIECVSKCKGEAIDIKYIKDGNIFETQMVPVKSANNMYKLGLWVRDTEAGIGTATFFEKSSNSFAALGHGIQDIDTKELVDISSGEFITTEILNIDKGEKENPGKIEGTIEKATQIGRIYSNTDFGIFGDSININKLNLSEINEVEVASRKEIELGKATVICTLEDGIRKEYQLEIQKIFINNNENNKSMIVKITDEELLEKTGGIVQGMSGSPIMQNGKLIGCLTHVFVSDPTKGYALFADIMLKKMQETK